MKIPSLRSLHPQSALSRAKLNDYARLTTETLLQSLEPGRPGSLKVRPDGTIIDGLQSLSSVGSMWMFYHARFFQEVSRQ